VSIQTDTTVQKALAVFHSIQQTIEQGEPVTAGLLSGKLGLALYNFSLYEAFEETAYANTCIELLEQVMNSEEGGADSLSGTSFANGTAGLGYLLSVLKKRGLIDIDLQEELKELDQSMTAIALQQIEEDRIDYLHGAMGVVHYFTTRSDEADIRVQLELLVTALCDKAVITDEGIWFRNFILHEKEKERIDSSLSHGSAGFLLLLLNVLEAGVLEARLREIIANGIRFILNQQMEINPGIDQYTVFPFSIHSENGSDKYFSQRLAWCYGDLNIVLLLYRAAAQLNKPGWKEIADKLAVQAIARTEVTCTMAVDAHFCHGTAGLAQLYKKIFNITSDQQFNKAAEYWITRTIQYVEDELKADFYANKECDLLNGLPGINLVLLSYVCKKDLNWSKLFLV
jgi:lantibiotic biosynthesis protein